MLARSQPFLPCCGALPTSSSCNCWYCSVWLLQKWIIEVLRLLRRHIPGMSFLLNFLLWRLRPDFQLTYLTWLLKRDTLWNIVFGSSFKVRRPLSNPQLAPQSHANKSAQLKPKLSVVQRQKIASNFIFLFLVPWRASSVWSACSEEFRSQSDEFINCGRSDSGDG